MSRELTEVERKWLETELVGSELALCGPSGCSRFGCGWGDLERDGYIRVERDWSGLIITRLK